ncbi:hypothetical protein [Helicobacter bilis]|uniref:Membrane transport protein MMPL domain-containing protein n=1 Tax=Helicobacter bilis TaxID=37372 RepID=A0A4U8UB05_9HELI|nr:hypothetical protein [Helicobacter bilis]MCI7410477.1 hypothetical protein [Helicobacter bilis]MDD7297210.1 hypothetical protein [Helicobacter bilis]MDY4400959.1 hypothetical protein [Helicobacter bilis]TLE12254.1 hypothetical protein LS79_000655 [Helicobacter bilis]
MRRFINVIALVFAVALFSLFFYNDKIKITQEVLDLFPQTEDKQIIDIYQKFANSNHILVAIKGFSQESTDTLDEFLSKIKDMPNIDSVITRTSASESLEDFLAQDYLYTASPKPLDKMLTKEEIESRVLNGLQSLQSQMLEEEVLDSGLIDIEKMRDSKDIESKQSVDSNKDSKKDISTLSQHDKKQNLDSNTTTCRAESQTEVSSIESNKDISCLRTQYDKDSAQKAQQTTQTTNNLDSKNIAKDKTTESSKDFSPKAQYDKNIESKHNAQSYNTIFHPSDPLQLLILQTPKPYIFVAKDYGYMAIVTMKDVKSESVKETLEGFARIATEYPNIRYFSQNFMSVENLGLILNEVNFLLSFATLAFITLYFVIIRIPLLTLNTICTLITANIIAILVVSSVYPKVTIMALSFGMGISNIAIDYMMHHNFFNLYVSAQRVFNRPVFYGYITTIIGFSACLFIPFPLLSQLSLYAIISLTLCYISFAFMYPKIGFSKPRLFPKLAQIRFQKVSSYTFLGLSLCAFVFAFMFLRLDFDLSKLDYQNKRMQNERTFFTNAQNNTTQILLSSSSLDSLIALARDLQDFLHTNNAKTFIPLSLMPTQNQMDLNAKFIESKLVAKNKAALLQSLPHLRTKILQILNEDSIDEDMSLEDKMAFIDDLFAMFKESYMLGDKPQLSLENLSHMGFNIVVEDRDSTSDRHIEALAEVSNIESQHDKILESTLTNHANKTTNSSDCSMALEALNELEGRSYLGDNDYPSNSFNRSNCIDKGEFLQNLDSTQSSAKRFYYLAIVNNSDLDYIKTFSKQLENAEQPKNIESSIEMRGLQHIMDNITDTIYKPMLIVLAIALCLMICMLFITAREAFLDSVVFVLFPLACTLCVIAAHSTLNIMHLFALLILVVVSVDYGIYSVKEGQNLRTAHAIFFSVLTTGVSFGILIISKTKALNSFGEVIFVGMLCILALLILHRPLYQSKKLS